MNRTESTTAADYETLTPAERAVCAKVAEGLTNRQIADELYVTVKAVEFHIHNAFLKLGVHNRTQLAIAHLAHADDGG